MNIDKLQYQTYNSYQELCKVLGESVKTGNAKITQLKLWDTYFTWTRIGHKYKIEKIYNLQQVPAMPDKPDLVFMKSFLLLTDLVDLAKGKPENEFTTVYKSYQDLYLLFGLVNEDYWYHLGLVRNLNEKTWTEEERKVYFDYFPKVHLAVTKEFYNDVKKVFSDSIDSVLAELNKYHFVEAEKIYVYYTKGDDRTPKYADGDMLSELKTAINRTLLTKKWQRNSEKVKKLYSEGELAMLGQLNRFYTDVAQDEELKKYQIYRLHKGFKFKFKNDLPKRVARYGEIMGVPERFRTGVNSSLKHTLDKQTRDRLEQYYKAIIGEGAMPKRPISELYGFCRGSLKDTLVSLEEIKDRDYENYIDLGIKFSLAVG